MVKKTKERYILERRLREMKKDLAYSKSNFLTRTNYTKQLTAKIKTLERKLK